MRLNKFEIRNYRTLENLTLDFPFFYSAICGKNDSGKTNVVRALRGLMEEKDPYGLQYEQELSVKEDYPKWHKVELKDRKISLSIEVSVSKDSDTELYEFLSTHLSLPKLESNLTFLLQFVYGGEEGGKEVTITVDQKKFTGLKADQVLEKLRTSRTVLFYNSTELDPRLRFGRGLSGFFREFSGEYSKQLDLAKETVNKRLRKVAKGYQRQLTELLGRLEGKFKAGLSVPTFDLGYVPYNMTLSDGKVDVALYDWGSGTRNRTLILLTLFRAREIGESSTSASKITPIIVIEEPESFLHPSAQAEFGRLLRGLSEEFKVQVITTTHSPYMLSHENPAANILLDRNTHYNQSRGTFRVDTSGENWMEPFGLALGINNDEFVSWKELFFNGSDAILLVEGETDKRYFELLRASGHGNEQLKFHGEIFAYGGQDTLKQTVLLKFIKDRYRKIFITFDLDAKQNVEKTLTALGFGLNKHYCAVGVDSPGKRDIEGLLPDSVKTAVHTANHELVEQARNGTQEERKSANSQLKKLFYERFVQLAKPGREYYGKFYPLVRIINGALN